MATATRTINPLPFEHLEPHRFEDLVRQLAYDFRSWNKLEATGRSGSDDGFDARGWEVVSTENNLNTESQSEEESDNELSEVDRIWLIQCKREKKITPKKLETYLEEIPCEISERPYGLLFVAACDFSKKARDSFISKCCDLGIKEFHLWAKAELEDLLYQPKYDHLLFAYFGISLQIRKRTIKTELRAKLAIKRKAYRDLTDCIGSFILLRDPTSNNYPYLEDENGNKTSKLWEQFKFQGFTYNGLIFVCRRHFAYIGDDGISWDYAHKQNDAKIDSWNDPWAEAKSFSETDEIRNEIWDFWNGLPKANQAWFEVVGIVTYEDILDIDKLGDDVVENPHIYVPFTYQNKPFKGFLAKVETTDSYDPKIIYPKLEDDNKVEIFPAKYK